MLKNKYFSSVISVIIASVVLAYGLVFAVPVNNSITIYSSSGNPIEGTASSSVIFDLKIVSGGNAPHTCPTNQGINDEGSQGNHPTVTLLLTFASSTLPVTGTFSPASPITVSGAYACNSLSLNVPGTIPAGSYTFTVNGTGEGFGDEGGVNGNGTLIIDSAPFVPTFTPLTVAGRVYEDLNADRDDESGADPSLSGWTISAFPIITSETDARATTTVTSTSTGYYFSFGPSDVGDWRIEETVKDGWWKTEPSGSYYIFTVSTTSESSTARHFGNYKNPVVQIFKFNDLNKNGMRDEGEPGIPNWPFVLGRQDDSNEGEIFFRIATTTTDSEGVASFEIHSKYYGAYIFEGMKTGWTRSYPISTNAFGTSTIVYDQLPFSDGTQVDTSVFYRLCEFGTESGSVVSVGSTSTTPCGEMTSVQFGNYSNTPTPSNEQPTTSGGGVVFNPNLPSPFGGNAGAGGTVLGANTSCGLYMDSNAAMGVGLNNDKNQVLLLQKFLNKHMNAGLTEDGVYDIKTKAAVEAFQLKYASDILSPWGLTRATGVVYYTTIVKINNLNCAELGLKINRAKLVPFSSRRNS